MLIKLFMYTYLVSSDEKETHCKHFNLAKYERSKKNVYTLTEY